MENEFSNRISVKNIVLAGHVCRISGGYVPVSLPMPTGVPITVQVFAGCTGGSDSWLEERCSGGSCVYFNRCCRRSCFVILKAVFCS